MYFTANSAATAGFMDQPPLKFAKARTISLLAECCSYALLHRKRASRRGLFRVNGAIAPLVRIWSEPATDRPPHVQKVPIADHPMTALRGGSCIVARRAIPRWKSPGIARHRGVSSVLSVAVETGVVTMPPVPAAGVDGVLP